MRPYLENIFFTNPNIYYPLLSPLFLAMYELTFMKSGPVNDGDPKSDCEEAGVHGPRYFVGPIYLGRIVIYIERNKLNYNLLLLI